MSNTTEEPLVWGHTVEGLVRCAKPRATPRWIEKMRAHGLDVDKPLATAYTREQWRRFIFTSAEELFEGPVESRLEQLGRDLINAYAQTFLGRAVAAVLRIIGPKRALERMTKSLRSGNNYSDTRATFTGPRRAEFWINETLGAPSYICGAIAAVMTIAGTPSVRVRTLSTDGHAATFEIEWDA